MSKNIIQFPPSLTDQAGLSSELEQQTRRAGDDAWIEVIQRMDEIYADLIHSQVELEKKNSELENAQLFIKSVMSSMSEVLIVCDINGQILQTNQALSDCLGIAETDLIQQPLAHLFSTEYQPMVADFPQHIRSGSLIDCEVDFLDVQQQTTPMSINCNARFDHNDRLSGFVITGRPLGELRRAYDKLHNAHEKLKNTQLQLIQSEKMASLGRLVAGVAHELNNPISFLYGNMHALKGYHQKFQQYLDAIHQGIHRDQMHSLRKKLHIDRMMDDIAPLVEGSLEGAERITVIVQNLRKFATPQEQTAQSFDLIPVIQRATSWVLRATSLKPHIQTDYPKQLIINNNEGYIHQILINLLQNAVDAMMDTTQPQLTICTQIRKQHIHISITDNGHGIAENNLVRIFDPFFTTKAVGSGTGLGLSISYGLATEQCQGDLKAFNHKTGGAEFILSLPY